jgi:hypothetical protein
MNTNEITSFLIKLLAKTSVKKFYVIGRDELAFVSFNSLPICIVVNTDLSTGLGYHWCGFYVKANPLYAQRAPISYFFDSYASAYSYYKFQPPFTVIQSNEKVLQAYDSDTCGLWTIDWLCHMSQGKSMKSFNSQYSNNLKENDAKLLRKYSKLFPIITSYINDKHCLTCSSRISNKL